MKVHIGKYRKNRKISVEIHDYDVWSLDHTAALILLPLFEKFRAQEKKGVSLAFYDRKCISTPHSDAEMQQAEERFHETLDKIIFSLREIVNCEQNSPDCPGEYIWEPEFKHIGCTEEEYEDFRNKTAQYDAKIQEGLDLMGKHFRDFWD